jgi:hypothetical protein
LYGIPPRRATRVSKKRKRKLIENDFDPARVLRAALDYAARGFSVFPCVYRTKRPAIPGGFHSATTNPATIRRWFGGTQRYNIAVRTGLASRIMVLDVDDRHGGFDGLRELQERWGPLPVTRTCRTGNGVHLWFGIAHEVASRKEDHIAKGVGTKADNTCVIVPPSVHPDGPTYTWENDEPIAPAPEWLVGLTRKPPVASISQRALGGRPSPQTNHGPPGAYGAAALRYECEALAAMLPETGRNNALNRASFRLHQLEAGGELDGAEIDRQLFAAAEINGLTTDPNNGPRRVWATIASGRRAGLQHPRSRP